MRTDLSGLKNGLLGGEYHTQDAALNTIEDSNKVAFLDWLTKQLSQKEVTKIEYDNCILCRTGNPVILFNEGLFVLQQESKAKSRTGFMLHIVDGRIREIMFCFSFAHRENKSQMEYDADEMNKLIAKGVPFIEAVETVLTARMYRYMERASAWPPGQPQNIHAT